MDKQIIEGYLFWSSGCEHGPTIMIAHKWDDPLYKRLESESWCDNEFLFRYLDDEGKNPEFEELSLGITPGRKQFGSRDSGTGHLEG